MKFKLYILTVALLAVSCSDNDLRERLPLVDETAEIQLAGKLPGTDADTRGLGMIQGTTPPVDLSMRIFRVDATSGTSYPGSWATTTITGTMAQGTSTIVTSPVQCYQMADANYTKLCALLPADGITSVSGNTVTYAEIDGADDIMFGAPQAGSRNADMPQLSFAHLLTCVKVRVKAADAKAAEIWGTVTGITINDKKTGVQVTLPSTTSGSTATVTATGTAAPLTMRQTASDVPLSTSITEYGYAMFVHTTASGVLTFNITTSNGGTHQVKVTAPAALSAGKIYTLDMTFKDANVTTTGQLSNWATGETVSGTVGA